MNFLVEKKNGIEALGISSTSYIFSVNPQNNAMRQIQFYLIHCWVH